MTDQFSASCATESLAPQSVREVWGMACPKCGCDDLQIDAVVSVRLTVDGTDEGDDGSHHWRDDSACECNLCAHKARVLDFSVEHQRKQAAEAQTVAGVAASLELVWDAMDRLANARNDDDEECIRDEVRQIVATAQNTIDAIQSAVPPNLHTNSTVETALCIWEAMIEARGTYCRQWFNDNGVSACRMKALDLAPVFDEAWSLLTTDERDHGSFDWEFVPLALNAIFEGGTPGNVPASSLAAIYRDHIKSGA